MLAPALRARHASPALAVALCALLTAGVATTDASAAKHKPHAVPAKTILHAAKARNGADRVLVVRARAMRRCLRRHGRCGAQRRAVQRAGTRLARTNHRLTRLARSSSRHPRPRLTAHGQRLRWTRVRHARSFVLRRYVPGQAKELSIVRGTATTPPPVPGARARYSVRAAAAGSAWSKPVTIAYAHVARHHQKPRRSHTPHRSSTQGHASQPSAPSQPSVPSGSATTPSDGTLSTSPIATSPAPSTTPSTTPPEASLADAKAAPALRVDGTQLSWARVAGIGTYVLMRSVPGQADRYIVVNDTAVTPDAVPGATVRYMVRTAVYGSAWSREVSIAYPDEQPPAQSDPPPPPTTQAPAPAEPDPSPPTSAPAPTSFSMGIVAGSALTYELPYIQALGARTARLEVEIDEPATQLDPIIDKYARAGIRPLLLAGFHGYIPTADQARNVATWAARFGPGGSFWQGKSYPANTAVTTIEFGNETSYSYQFSDTAKSSTWWALPSYTSRAQAYALRFKDAQTAIQAVNPKVGLLAIGENGDTNDVWLRAMFQAVPDLAKRVAGWTVHPYGPSWQKRIDAVIANTKALGAPDTIPIDITEWGISTDDGRCLDDNYGWNRCMTYDQAASTLSTTVAAMRARYGSRLRSLYLYQAHDQDATGADSGREGYFGALQSDEAPKGAFTRTVESLLASNP